MGNLTLKSDSTDEVIAKLEVLIESNTEILFKYRGCCPESDRVVELETSIMKLAIAKIRSLEREIKDIKRVTR